MTKITRKRIEREKILEAMLFASGEGVPLEKLANALGTDIPLMRNILERMAAAYKKEDAGIILVEADGCYRLATNPIYYDSVALLLKSSPPRKLSIAMLETLAIIAFKQPCTRSVVDTLRGTNSHHIVNKLVDYGLVEEAGRLQAPGRPIIFATTEQFLIHFGIRSAADLLKSIPDNQMTLSEVSPHVEE